MRSVQSVHGVTAASSHVRGSACTTAEFMAHESDQHRTWGRVHLRLAQFLFSAVLACRGRRLGSRSRCLTALRDDMANLGSGAECVRRAVFALSDLRFLFTCLCCHLTVFVAYTDVVMLSRIIVDDDFFVLAGCSSSSSRSMYCSCNSQCVCTSRAGEPLPARLFATPSLRFWLSRSSFSCCFYHLADNSSTFAQLQLVRGQRSFRAISSGCGSFLAQTLGHFTWLRCLRCACLHIHRPLLPCGPRSLDRLISLQSRHC